MSSPLNGFYGHTMSAPNGGDVGNGVAAQRLDSGSIPNPIPPSPGGNGNGNGGIPDGVMSIRRSWILEHPGATLTLAGAIWAGIHYVANFWLHQQQRPVIESVQRDIRVLATHQLEVERANREILTKIAKTQGIEYTISRDLEDAQNAVRKLRNR